MKNKCVWSCGFCGKLFPTKKKRDKHELSCQDKNKKDAKTKLKFFIKKIKFLNLVFWIIGVYLLAFFAINSFANENSKLFQNFLSHINGSKI